MFSKCSVQLILIWYMRKFWFIVGKFMLEGLIKAFKTKLFIYYKAETEKTCGVRAILV